MSEIAYNLKATITLFPTDQGGARNPFTPGIGLLLLLVPQNIIQAKLSL